MKNFKKLASDWLPSPLTRLARRIKGDEIKFEGAYPTWEEARVLCTGYETKEILEKVLAATLKVKHGEAVFERDSVLFEKVDYTWPVLAGLMWAAARNCGSLNVLDFGGALGSCYFQNIRFLCSIPEIRWNVVEQTHYVEIGRSKIEDERLHFYYTVDECLTQNQPNVIFLSSVLQYLPAPKGVLLSLLKSAADTIIIDRTVVNHSSEDRFYIQHVPPSIYSASYPCRSLSEQVLHSTIGAQYKLIEDFPSLSFPALVNINSEFKGYIFCRS